MPNSASFYSAVEEATQKKPDHFKRVPPYYVFTCYIYTLYYYNNASISIVILMKLINHLAIYIFRNY